MESKSVLPLATAAEIAALRRIAEEAPRHASIRRVVAFGSRVRGDFRGDSDLDILLLLREIGDRDEVVSLLCRIEIEFDVPLSPVIYTTAEYDENRRLRSGFVENVEREGVVLYDAERATEG